MKKVLMVLGVIVVLLVLFVLLMPGPSVKEYEGLINPQITGKADQKMLVVETRGDPNKTGKEVFSKLYGMLYQLKGTNKEVKPACPKARWQNLGKTKDEMAGSWGIPVPDSVTELPAQKGEPVVKLDTWKYGEVAEILHIGSYGAETPTIEKLKKFITDSGYVIAGDHEEEYLRGPEKLFRSPDKYWTIIRYNVKKKK